jgi:hypothetical protein
MYTHLGSSARLVLALGLMVASLSSGLALAAENSAAMKPATNKLLHMYRFFYLPFSIDFREGRNKDEILPYVADGSNGRLMTAQEMIQLDGEWKQMRAGIRPKALLLSTSVPVDGTLSITNKLLSHKLPLNRSAFDRIPISDRMMMAKALEGKPEAVRNAFRQLQFLKTFTKGLDQNALHFFVVSPSWCQSSREYRMLFETYFKRFPQKSLVLHSIVLEDPTEKIFDSRVLAELFPNKEKYSHDNVPKFLAVELKDGKPTLWEEGQALEQLYQRFYAKHRGHLDSKTVLFGNRSIATQAPSTKILDPKLSASPN